MKKNLILILLVLLSACQKDQAKSESDESISSYLHDPITAKKVHAECVAMGDSRKGITRCANAETAISMKITSPKLLSCYKPEINHACIDTYLQDKK